MTPEQIKAANIGKLLARKIFEGRGNHSEAHITEKELAAMFEAAALLALGKTAAVATSY
jgi:site-specific recombinase